jgi:hypothetical protein
MDMSKTKLYDWNCDICKQNGVLRVVNPDEQKLRVEIVEYSGTFASEETYYFKHICGQEILLTNPRK